MQSTGSFSLTKKLVPLLEPLEASIPEKHYRVVPSAFDAADPYLRALPLATGWHWDSLAAHLKKFSPQTIIVQLPLFWQLEPFIFLAARSAEAPLCSIEKQNYPLDKAAILLASANAVLAEATEAAAIAEYLHTEQVELPPYWVLLHRADAHHWNLSPLLKNRNLAVAQEVHLAPGVPLLVQCETIVAAHTDQYHWSDLFNWNMELQAPSISTNGALPFTLKDFTLPFTLAEKGICACGKMLLARMS